MVFLFQLLEAKFNVNATFHSSSEEDEEVSIRIFSSITRNVFQGQRMLNVNLFNILNAARTF